jgi:phage terminase large subunit
MIFNFNEHEDEIFTPVFYRIHEAKTRYVVVYGGSGSSKSYSAHQNELLSLMESEPGDTLVIRKYAADLRESCFKLFMQLIDAYALRSEFDCVYSNDNRRITCLHTGKTLVFKGIDDPEKLKSIVAFKRILIEEASQLQFSDFLELNRRVRGIHGIQIIMLLNPVSENHWIKTKFCEQHSPYFAETTTLRFTYHDNCIKSGACNLTRADINELERLKEIDANQYRIYVLAEWGVDNTEGKFCWAFTRGHIKPTVYDEERILWASFDFNVNPLTCTLAQVYPDEKTVRALDCVKLENSDIWKMCNRLKTMYPDALWHVTGDATGRSRNAISPDNINYYQVIERQLRLTQAQLKVPRVNPPIEENRFIVNAILKNWLVEIDPERCKPLIYDLTYVEVDSTGGIMKNRNSSKSYADFLDNWRYLMNTAVRPHIDFMI